MDNFGLLVVQIGNPRKRNSALRPTIFAVTDAVLLSVPMVSITGGFEVAGTAVAAFVHAKRAFQTAWGGLTWVVAERARTQNQ